MADSHHGLAPRAIAAVEALRQILRAITCAGKLVTVAREVRDATEDISSSELNALLNVLDIEFERRLHIARAAVGNLPTPPAAHKAG